MFLQTEEKMKRFLSCSIALLLLLTAFSMSLTGCDSPDSESSVPDSSAEESNQSEESSIMINISEDPSYSNVALNKTYTKSSLYPVDKPSYPDENNNSMTDGVRPAENANYTDKAFMGFSRSAPDYSENGYSLLTVDLGGLYYLDKFVVSTASAKFLSVGIDAPSFVWIYVSNDGKNWYCAGKTSHVDDPKKSLVESELVLDAPVTAKYVQYRFCINAGGWLFVSEVEAFGITAEKAVDYPEQQVDKRILFVGNSTTYFFNIPYKVAFLAKAAGMNVEVEYCCGGGAYLHQYANASSSFGKLFRDKLKKFDYDYVVLQDNGNAGYDESKPALDILVPLIRETGAEVVLYKRYSSNSDPAQRINSAYRHEVNYSKLAETFEIEKIAPSADAFLICTEKYPAINLYHTDNSHHSENGAYLNACVLAITYLGLDLTDNTYTASLDEETAKALRECAKIACEQGYDYSKNK